MMVIYEGRVSRLERVFAEKPPIDMLQHVNGNTLRALPHRGNSEVGSMRNQQRQQRRVDVLRPRFVAAQRLKRGRARLASGCVTRTRAANQACVNEKSLRATESDRNQPEEP